VCRIPPECCGRGADASASPTLRKQPQEVGWCRQGAVALPGCRAAGRTVNANNQLEAYARWRSGRRPRQTIESQINRRGLSGPLTALLAPVHGELRRWKRDAGAKRFQSAKTGGAAGRQLQIGGQHAFPTDNLDATRLSAAAVRYRECAIVLNACPLVQTVQKDPPLGLRSPRTSGPANSEDTETPGLFYLRQAIGGAVFQDPDKLDTLERGSPRANTTFKVCGLRAVTQARPPPAMRALFLFPTRSSAQPHVHRTREAQKTRPKTGATGPKGAGRTLQGFSATACFSITRIDGMGPGVRPDFFYFFCRKRPRAANASRAHNGWTSTSFFGLTTEAKRGDRTLLPVRQRTTRASCPRTNSNRR